MKYVIIYKSEFPFILQFTYTFVIGHNLKSIIAIGGSFKTSLKWTIVIALLYWIWNCTTIQLKFPNILYILTYSKTSLTNLNGSSSDVYHILNICPNLGKNLLNDFSELVLVSFQTSIVIVEVLSWLQK